MPIVVSLQAMRNERATVMWKLKIKRQSRVICFMRAQRRLLNRFAFPPLELVENITIVWRAFKIDRFWDGVKQAMTTSNTADRDAKVMRSQCNHYGRKAYWLWWFEFWEWSFSQTQSFLVESAMNKREGDFNKRKRKLYPSNSAR